MFQRLFFIYNFNEIKIGIAFLYQAVLSQAVLY